MALQAGAGAPQDTRIGRESALYRPTSLALFAAGFSTFGLLYFVQPLLPVFTQDFGVSPAVSSLALSGTTAIMAFALFLSGMLSDRIGRKRIMAWSLFSSALLTLVMAVMPIWEGVLAVRILMGISLSGVQAVAMAYLSEEFTPAAFGRSMGLFISGGAIGGLGGRLIAGVLADFTGWRIATAIMGAAALASAFYFARNLPASRHFHHSDGRARDLLPRLAALLRDRVFLLLYCTGFLIMGGFVMVYNYVGYRLLEPPFDLPQSVVGLIFVIYVAGIVGSPWAGERATRIGHGNVLWLLAAAMIAGTALTLPDSLWTIVAGLTLLTFGFFSAHSVASGWVSRRARQNRAVAASGYLFFYYMGSSIIGTSGGLFWQAGGWAAVAALGGILTLAALGIALYLRTAAGTTGP